MDMEKKDKKKPVSTPSYYFTFVELERQVKLFDGIAINALRGWNS